MSLFTYNLSIDENATFVQAFAFKNADDTIFDLTGYTNAKASIKKFFSDLVPLFDFICTIDVPTGTITLKLSPANTDALANTFPRPEANKDNSANKGVWDLFVTDPTGNVVRFASGQVQVLARVTA